MQVLLGTDEVMGKYDHPDSIMSYFSNIEVREQNLYNSTKVIFGVYFLEFLHLHHLYIHLFLSACHVFLCPSRLLLSAASSSVCHIVLCLPVSRSVSLSASPPIRPLIHPPICSSRSPDISRRPAGGCTSSAATASRSRPPRRRCARPSPAWGCARGRLIAARSRPSRPAGGGSASLTSIRRASTYGAAAAKGKARRRRPSKWAHEDASI